MSNPARTITGKVTGIKRTTSSVNGNPAFFVTIAREDGYEETVRTQTDSMIAYGIENPEYRDERHLFKLTLANRLYGADRLEDFPLDRIPADGSCVNCGNPGAVEGLCSACAADAAEHAALAVPSLPTCIACGYVASFDYVALADACPRCGASPFIEATVQVTR